MALNYKQIVPNVHLLKQMKRMSETSWCCERFLGKDEHFANTSQPIFAILSELRVTFLSNLKYSLNMHLKLNPAWLMSHFFDRLALMLIYQVFCQHAVVDIWSRFCCCIHSWRKTTFLPCSVLFTSYKGKQTNKQQNSNWKQMKDLSRVTNKRLQSSTFINSSLSIKELEVGQKSILYLFFMPCIWDF